MTDDQLSELYNSALARFGPDPPWEIRQREANRRRYQRRYIMAAELEIHRAAGNVIQSGAAFSFLIDRPAPEKLSEVGRAEPL